MGIWRSTVDYEAWLRKQLNGEIVESDIAKKHARMCAGALPFLRATYWRWVEKIGGVCRGIEKAPQVLAVGDTHIENFGTWRDQEGRLVWGVNDFDEAAEMPYLLDLVRLATSASLAKVPRMSTAEVSTCVLKGYRCGVEAPGPWVVDRHHAWLRKFVTVSDADRAAFWEKFPPKSDDFDGGKTDPCAGRYPIRAERVTRRIKHKNAEKPPGKYAKSLNAARPIGSKAELEFTYWPRSAGTGSLGRPRWIGYGEWRGAPVIREAKAIVPSAWTREHGGSPKLRCADAGWGVFRAPDPWYRLHGNVLVRRLSPNNHKIELDKVDPADLINPRMLMAMSRDLAGVHLGTRGARAKINADLADGTREATFSLWVESAVDFIVGDQASWSEACKRHAEATEAA